jgi:hypothetical protein
MFGGASNSFGLRVLIVALLFARWRNKVREELQYDAMEDGRAWPSSFFSVPVLPDIAGIEMRENPGMTVCAIGFDLVRCEI